MHSFKYGACGRKYLVFKVNKLRNAIYLNNLTTIKLITLC